MSDKTGLAELGAGLVARGFELVSTGGTARALREAGLPVTDVADVTGFPEMLDGRVKTLHPRVHAGLLADRRRADHRQALAAAGIAPFELVVVNLYPFAEAARRPGISLDDLVEEIDIGGPSMVRAAAKNHASVAIVTSPARYDGRAGRARRPRRGARSGCARRSRSRRSRTPPPTTPGSPPSCPAGCSTRACRCPRSRACPAARIPYPPVLTISMAKVETLRYGENPHQPAARYRRTDREPRAAEGPFASGEPPLQGKALSYNNVLDASAAAALARLLRGHAVVIVKHTNPCGAAERDSLLEAWDAALAGDPVSAFGGVVALTGAVDRALAERLTSLFLEVVVAPAFDAAALEVLATKPNLRLVVDPSIDARRGPHRAHRPRPARYRLPGLRADRRRRRAGHRARPAARRSRPPGRASRPAARPTPSSATSTSPGVSPGASSRTRSSSSATGCWWASARGRSAGSTRAGAPSTRRASSRATMGAVGAAAASDAFFPFADGPRLLLEAGVQAIVQPGGSMRDAEVLVAVEEAGAAMLVTGTRHFRH